MKSFFAKLEKNKQWLFLILAIVLVIIYSISISPKTVQNDIFYNISIGKWISENGIDMKDHFSWHELPYTYPHWLYDFMMYRIFSFGEWDAIYISTCIFSAILGVTVFLTNSKLTKNKLFSFLVTIAVMYLIKDYITARAQLVTFILLMLLLYNIERFLERKKMVNVITILSIHILIANLHVAVWPFTFILYLPYVAEYLISVGNDVILYSKIQIFILRQRKKHSKKDTEKLSKKIESIENSNIKIQEKRKLEKPYKITITKNPNTKWLILVICIAIFTGLLTPLGKVPYTYNYLTLVGNTMKNINEHLPLTLANNVQMECTLIILLVILTFFNAKIKLSDLLMLGGLCYLMFHTRRQQSIFVLLGSVAFVRLLIDSMEKFLNATSEEICNKCINKFTTIIMTLIVLCMSINSYNDIKKDNYINKRTYPIEASEWILENLDVNKIKLYNEYNYGSYLIYKNIPVFIDSRADLYAPEFNTPTGDKQDGTDIFSAFINTSNMGSYYGDLFKKYNITHVIIYKTSKINMMIEKADAEKYKKLYEDDYFVIYEVLDV